MSWQPTMDWHTAKQRAAIIASIRKFFCEKGVVEVETPQLSHSTITDVHLDAIEAQYDWAENGKVPLFLQTSPEFAMKRLLAAGYQSIYQIGKAFRNESEGRLHNPEFTLLEWYRIGFSMEQLISEVAELIQLVLQTKGSEIISYQQAFIEYTGIDPLEATIEDCLTYIKSKGKLETWLEEANCLDTLLQFVFCEFIETNIGQEAPCFVHSFPATQASLATINESDMRIVNRFECYFKGVELVNGFDELTDANVQTARFVEDNRKREVLNKQARQIDSRFISALSHGLPECAGVALGIDRLVMLALNKTDIKDVISFPTSQA